VNVYGSIQFFYHEIHIVTIISIFLTYLFVYKKAAQIQQSKSFKLVVSSIYVAFSLVMYEVYWHIAWYAVSKDTYPLYEALSFVTIGFAVILPILNILKKQYRMLKIDYSLFPVSFALSTTAICILIKSNFFFVYIPLRESGLDTVLAHNFQWAIGKIAIMLFWAMIFRRPNNVHS